MNGLGRRLDALEQIAEQCRRREQWNELRTEIARRYAADGIVLGAGEIDQKADRALVLAEHMALLAAGGLTLEQIAYRVAVEHDLDPARVVAVFAELQAARGR